MKNNLWKNFIMTMITLAAALIGDMENVQWGIVGITMLGNAIVYFPKNIWLPSTSENGSFNSRDIISGAIIAVGTFLTTNAATLIVNGEFDLIFALKAVGGVVLGYVIKTFKSNIGTLK